MVFRTFAFILVGVPKTIAINHTHWLTRHVMEKTQDLSAFLVGNAPRFCLGFPDFLCEVRNSKCWSWLIIFFTYAMNLVGVLGVVRCRSVLFGVVRCCSVLFGVVRCCSIVFTDFIHGVCLFDRLGNPYPRLEVCGFTFFWFPFTEGIVVQTCELTIHLELSFLWSFERPRHVPSRLHLRGKLLKIFWARVAEKQAAWRVEAAIPAVFVRGQPSGLLSGDWTVCFWESPIARANHLHMATFQSYVKLPDGIPYISISSLLLFHSALLTSVDLGISPRKNTW